jgi:hypothetical protein
MAKNQGLFKALSSAATNKPATPEVTAHSEPVAYYQAPSREGKLHLSAWLPPEYKTSMRAIQMKRPDVSLQDLFAEALNDLFSKYDVPVISDGKPEPRRTRRAGPHPSYGR